AGQGFVDRGRALEQLGRLVLAAQEGANPAHLVEASGQSPAELDDVWIATDEPLVERHRLLGRPQGRIEFPRGRQGLAEVAPAPAQIVAVREIPGLIADEGLMDRQGLPVEVQRVDRAAEIQLDYAEVGERPG